MTNRTLIGAAIAAAAAAAIVVPSAVTSPPSTSGQYCGSERAAVKHLTDGFVPTGTPTVMTVAQLAAMPAPAVTASSPRLPLERALVALVGVHLVAAKQEPDSDLHLILASPTGVEMNVESPMAVCDSASPWASLLASARASADAVLGPVSSSSYTPENLTVTVEGLLFFDVLHGQRGADNGVELHPVTYFAIGSTPPTPPPPTTTATQTTPTTTTTTTVDDTVDELPGCAEWPGRIYLHGHKQDHCAAAYFTTPRPAA